MRELETMRKSERVRKRVIEREQYLKGCEVSRPRHRQNGNLWRPIAKSYFDSLSKGQSNIRRL